MTASFNTELFSKLCAVGIVAQKKKKGKKKMPAFFTTPTFVPSASRLVFLDYEPFFHSSK
jgi:hypothetical protein